MDSSQTPDEKKQTEGTSSAGQIYQGGQMRRRLSAEIDTKWTDLLLLVCFLCAGIIDSMAFALYGCFVSMQTGKLHIHIILSILTYGRKYNIR